eukprot:11971161-Alexandrium_andersonii.AAC.1
MACSACAPRHSSVEARTEVWNAVTWKDGLACVPACFRDFVLACSRACVPSCSRSCLLAC